ncbi:hypothetical protein OTERR_12620 [Oryzomicrobium terrae]|uniref:Uncharacterized protein n=1 Tax=Oryzomicrobium terrae TaxID=1735038 RepID=A0A5C1E922_9RHOO|nr:hypothetical protein [Oryzomicrobium terrae]QEL64738.1 hypothetical protein OTERR_12620 [Oryzomicrobium terrae]
MSKHDYTAFDAELLAQIKAGRNRLMKLEIHKPLLAMAKPYCDPSTNEWEVIARRLQVLRQTGKIRYTGTVWEIITREGR